MTARDTTVGLHDLLISQVMAADHPLTCDRSSFSNFRS